MEKRELIDMFKNKIFPKQAEDLLKMNYEGLGELDKREFLRDTSILIMLAEKGLKSEQEPTTKNDLAVDWESYKDVDGNSLDDLILEVLQNNFDCGNTYGYKVADEIIGLLPSVTPQEPILDEIRAEIAEYGSIMVAYAITKDTKTDKGIEKLVSDVLKQAKKQVLAMIDKYKAESEG